MADFFNLEKAPERLKQFLGWFDPNCEVHGVKVRHIILAVIAGVLTIFAAGAAYELYPKSYELRISGGGILTNRHFLATVLQREARKKGIVLIVTPVRKAAATRDKLVGGELDLAFVQGGQETLPDGIEHVATVLPELVHLLVKRDIEGMAYLKGKRVNMGAKLSDARAIFTTVTRFAGYHEGVDFVDLDYTAEKLLELPDDKLPDAVFLLSSVPSYLAERLVQDHHYHVVEIPFPESLALRHGWASNGKILAYTYGQKTTAPEKAPNPEKDIVTVAVNMHLIANATVDPKAISELLEVLYSPSVHNVVPVDGNLIAIPSGYPLSPGLTRYLARDEPLLTHELGEKLKSLCELAGTLLSMGLVVRRWSKGIKEEDVNKERERFVDYLEKLAGFETQLIELEAKAPPDDKEARVLLAAVGALRLDILKPKPPSKVEDVAPRFLDLLNPPPKGEEVDPQLLDRTEQRARWVYEHARQLCARGAPPPGRAPEAALTETPGGGE